MRPGESWAVSSSPASSWGLVSEADGEVRESRVAGEGEGYLTRNMSLSPVSSLMAVAVLKCFRQCCDQCPVCF